MKKNFVRSYLVPGLIVLVVGVLLVAVFWLIYFGIYMAVETLFYPTTPTEVPAGLIRDSSAIALMIVYLLLLKTKLPELWKATFLVAPLAMILISIVLSLYTIPAMAVLVFILVVGVDLYVIYFFKRPWLYYYATVIAIIVSLLYAWPRP